MSAERRPNGPEITKGDLDRVEREIRAMRADLYTKEQTVVVNGNGARRMGETMAKWALGIAATIIAASIIGTFVFVVQMSSKLSAMESTMGWVGTQVERTEADLTEHLLNHGGIP